MCTTAPATEQWMVITGFPRYSISTMGRIKVNETSKIMALFLAGPATSKYYSTPLSENGKKTNCKPHRLVALHFIPNPSGLTDVDHINGDRLDNRVENLRWASRSQNNANCRGRRTYGGKAPSSQYKGVLWSKQRGKWMARICLPSNDGKLRQKFLGYYVTEKAAADAYDRAARLYYGNFALTNAAMSARA